MENAASRLDVKATGRQQAGGYANEAFHDAEKDRWIVFSWLGSGLHGSVDCRNDVARVMPGCWWGAQSLPRVVSLQPDGRTVKFPVVPEIEELLVGPGSSGGATVRMAGHNVVTLDNTSLVGPQSRVRVIANISDISATDKQWSGAFGVDVLPRPFRSPCTATAWESDKCLVTRVSVDRLSANNGKPPVTLLKLQSIHPPGGQEGGVSLEVPYALAYTFDIWLDRGVVEVYGDGGAQVLVAKTGITSEPEPRALHAWATGSVNSTSEVAVQVLTHPVKSAVFKSDPGPWNPS